MSFWNCWCHWCGILEIPGYLNHRMNKGIRLCISQNFYSLCARMTLSPSASQWSLTEYFLSTLIHNYSGVLAESEGNRGHVGHYFELLTKLIELSLQKGILFDFQPFIDNFIQKIQVLPGNFRNFLKIDFYIDLSELKKDTNKALEGSLAVLRAFFTWSPHCKKNLWKTTSQRYF